MGLKVGESFTLEKVTVQSRLEIKESIIFSMNIIAHYVIQRNVFNSLPFDTAIIIKHRNTCTGMRNNDCNAAFVFQAGNHVTL